MFRKICVRLTGYTDAHIFFWSIEGPFSMLELVSILRVLSVFKLVGLILIKLNLLVT